MTGPLTLLALLLTHSVGSWGLPPAVVPDAELEILEAQLDETLAANRARRCPRAVLRGAPSPGPAAHDLALVAAGGAGLAECYDFLGEFAPVLFAPPDGSERQTGLVNRFTEICRPLPRAVARAVSHEDACSPFMPGRQGLPDIGVLLRGLAAARQLGALAVLSGDARAGVDRFVDVIRLCQDLVRGGVPLILAMRTTSILHEVVANDLSQLIARPELSTEDLARLAEALEGLVASEPSFPRCVAADTTWLAVEAGLPMLHPAGWEPPGGFSQGRQVTERDRSPDLFPLIPVDRERGIIFSAIMDLDRRRRAACPVGASPAQCAAGLQALTAARSAEEGRPSWLRWLLIIGSPEPRRALRRELQARMQARVYAPFERYAPLFAGRSFHLAVTRFLAEVHLELRRTGRCPDTSALAAERWRRVLGDPIFGGTLGTRRGGEVSYVVTTRGGFPGEGGAARPLTFELSVPECKGR